MEAFTVQNSSSVCTWSIAEQSGSGRPSKNSIGLKLPVADIPVPYRLAPCLQSAFLGPTPIFGRNQSARKMAETLCKPRIRVRACSAALSSEKRSQNDPQNAAFSKRIGQQMRAPMGRCEGTRSGGGSAKPSAFEEDLERRKQQLKREILERASASKKTADEAPDGVNGAKDAGVIEPMKKNRTEVEALDGVNGAKDAFVIEPTGNRTADEAPDGANGAKDAGVNAGGVNKFRSSWDAKDVTGRTYIENLGKESENVNVVVGAREGMVDPVFIGDFLGKEADIVFKYRQKVTRQFGHIHGDYYIAPSFMDKVVNHIVKNFMADQINARVPLILGVWGGKGQGKSFQVELIFRALGLEPVIMSAGEMESEWAGTPAKLIRDRYRAAGQVVKVQGKMSALVINDLDAGAGRFDNTQMTVNTQMVMGTLMNLADDPTRVSVGQEFREADIVPRVPIIVTGNDLTTLWAPLIRDGRMDKFFWAPSREDMVNIVTCMYRKDGLELSDIEALVDIFPNQALDFYGAMRSRTYDSQVKKWLDGVGGPEKLRTIFPVRPGKEQPALDHYQQTLDNLIAAGKELVEEQELVMTMNLAEEYFPAAEAGGGGLLTSTS